MHNNHIDFVLPWVDSSDSEWQNEKNHYSDVKQKDKAESTRFRDMHTLQYVLRSIEKHCPWYNKIYLITTGHYPEWLNIEHPKIELITHKELFIDQGALPVFNSNAIEMNLVNIPQLSEKFVYLSDDTLIWNPINIDRFFKKNKPVDFFYHGWVPRNKIFEFIKSKDSWVDSLNNNLKLLNNTIDNKITLNQLYHKSYSPLQKISNFLYKNIYKKPFWIAHWHHPQPYLKQTILDTYKAFSSEMIKTSHHKFRSSQDLTPYLYRYYHLLQGEFEPYYHNDGLVVQITSLQHLKMSILHIEKLQNIKFICFNDQMNNNNYDEFNKISIFLKNHLHKKFPDKASFEKEYTI